MKTRIAALAVFGLVVANAAANPYVRQFPAEGVLTFVLEDHLDHPSYWWPVTLLRYRVEFAGAKVRPDELALTEGGKLVTMQLAGVRTEGDYLESALVCFQADLKPGARREFVLGRRALKADAVPGVKETREGNSIVLDTGVIRARIPSTLQDIGPVQQVSRDGRWVGSSKMLAGRALTGFKAERIEKGPLLIAYRLAWTFAGGVQYIARVEAIAGYDYIGLDEEMNGWPAGSSARWDFSFDGFSPTHRQAPNHPYQKPNAAPGYGRYDWERIDEGSVGTQHGVSSGLSAQGELPFRLGVYQPWGAYVTLTSANFWDERNGDAAGLFIDKAVRWQDHEYAVWSSSNTLQVRYYYTANKLIWRWPVAEGTRSTGFAFYDHAKDVKAQEDLDDAATHPVKYRDGQVYRANLSPMSHTMMLQNRHGTIDLDMMKDWVLEYPKAAKQPEVVLDHGNIRNADELERRVFTSELIRDLPRQGTRQNAGFAPVPSRSIYDWFVDGFDRLRSQFTERQRERLDAAYLLLGYTHGEEEYMPLKNMLAGHPNFLSDVKSAPGFMAFLFPEHPMAKEWADEFEKFVELNTRYHTRPAVASWEAHGGRWTENLGTYVWAFLRPAIRANFLLRNYVDGKNRLAVPELAMMGDWLVNSLSAPYAGEDPKWQLGPDGKLAKHFWGMVTPERAPRRVHPPQGAHAWRRMPPSSMWLLGTLLRNFDPLTAEHVMWAARPGDEDSEEMASDPFRAMYGNDDNRGTNPRLRSAAYTGYGVTLRAGVDTPEELSVHLQQIDEGPNYRWGIAGEGGCGVIYFYAAGKSYSHNGREDVGDRAAQDTDFSTNFGVWKNGAFRSIGRNVLDKPLKDLGAAQYAKITPRQGAEAYAWPEYQSRSVMLAGTDYFAVYDHVFNDAVAHRFSWFTEAHEEMPEIHLVKGAGREPETARTAMTTSAVHGFWQDGMGDSMAIVSHRKDLRIVPKSYGAQVISANWTDRVMEDSVGLKVRDSGAEFTGKAGWIREYQSGQEIQMAVVDGSRIADHGIELEVSAGVAASVKSDAGGELRGRFVAVAPGWLQLRGGVQRGMFYVDGERAKPVVDGEAVRMQLPAGHHKWQWTARSPEPAVPQVLRTEEGPDSALVYFRPAAGAEQYRAEVSRDGGATWQAAGTVAASPMQLHEITAKVHVRVRGVNAAGTVGEAGDDYPVYPAHGGAAHPDGLKLLLGKDTVDARWGEVLGVKEYRLYRRKVGEKDFALVYRGLNREYKDRPPGVIRAFDEPGLSADAARRSVAAAKAPVIYEYAVAAVNGSGEGKWSTATDTDPASWRNWDPKPGEAFRRRYTYNTTNYSRVGEEADTTRYYPAK